MRHNIRIMRSSKSMILNLDGACKAESHNPCYTFFLQEKKPKAQLNFHVNKYRSKGANMSERRGGSPDLLFLLLKKECIYCLIPIKILDPVDL